MGRFKRLVFHKPEKLVKRCRFYEQRRVKFSGRRLQRWIMRYAHRPGSMLGECYGRNCPNSRLRSCLRENFIRQLCYSVQGRWGTVIPELQCIMWGSGMLLQELIVLTHLSHVIELKKINVVCYDPEYVPRNRDEEIILNARFNQIKILLRHLAPHIMGEWSMVSSQTAVTQSMSSQAPILFCAVDIELEPVLAFIKDYSAGYDLLALVLDDAGRFYDMKITDDSLGI